MKKLLLVALLLLSTFSFAQMKATKGVYQGLAYKHYDGPGQDLVVVLQGSGEFTRTLDGSDLDKFIDLNSYASYAKSGKVYPFDILVAASYRAPNITSGNPDQKHIKAQLANLVKTFNPRKVILTGYSFGGQAAAGFLTKSCNSKQVKQSDGTYKAVLQSTEYLGSEIFDAYIIMCGKAPGTQDWQINKSKPIAIVHGELDTAVPISNGVNIMNKFNAAIPSFKVYPDYAKKTVKVKNADGTYTSTQQWLPVAVPVDATSRFIFIKYTSTEKANHESSWRRGYDINHPVGKQVYDFILKVIAQ